MQAENEGQRKLRCREGTASRVVEWYGGGSVVSMGNMKLKTKQTSDAKQL